MKRILKIAVWMLYLTGLGFLVGFVEARRETVEVHVPEIFIDQSGGHLFVTRDNVLEELSNIGCDFTGTQLKEIDVNRMEKTLGLMAGVKNAEVFKNLSGTLHIKITQREPILRVINARGLHAYIDVDGRSMPVSDQYTARVIVFNGHINDPLYNFDMRMFHNDSLKRVYLLDDIFLMANYLRADTLFNALITQVYVNEKQEFELIPRVGNQRIMFGTADNYTEKFKKLEAFYTKGSDPRELNLYDTITVKYNKLIICSKR